MAIRRIILLRSTSAIEDWKDLRRNVNMQLANHCENPVTLELEEGMKKNLRVLYHDNCLTVLASAAVFSRFFPLSCARRQY